MIKLFKSCWYLVCNLLAGAVFCWYFLACVKKNINKKQSSQQVVNKISTAFKQCQKRVEWFLSRLIRFHTEVFVVCVVLFIAFVNAVYSEVIVHSTEGEVVYTGDAVYVTGAGSGGGGDVTNIWGVCSNCVYMTPEECLSISSSLDRIQREIAVDCDRLYSQIQSFSNSFISLTNEIFRFTFTNIPDNSYHYTTRFNNSTNFDNAFSPSFVYLRTLIGTGIPYQYVEHIAGDLFRAQLDSFSRNLSNSAYYGVTNLIIHLFEGGNAVDFTFPNPITRNGYLQYTSDFYNFYFGSLPQILQNFSNVSLLSEDVPYHGPSQLRIPFQLSQIASNVKSIDDLNKGISNNVLNRLNCSSCKCEGQACTNITGSSGCPTCEQMNVITGAMHDIVRDLENIQFPQTNILPAIYKLIAQSTKPISIDVFNEDWEQIYSGSVSPLSQSWEYMPTNQMQRIELLLWSLTSLNSPSNIEEISDSELKTIQSNYSNDWNSAGLSFSNRIIRSYNQTSNLVSSFASAFSELKISPHTSDIIYSHGFEFNLGNVPTIHIPEIKIEADRLEGLTMLRSVSTAFWYLASFGVGFIFWQSWMVRLLRIIWRLMVRMFAILNQFLDM